MNLFIFHSGDQLAHFDPFGVLVLCCRSDNLFSKLEAGLQLCTIAPWWLSSTEERCDLLLVWEALALQFTL